MSDADGKKIYYASHLLRVSFNAELAKMNKRKPGLHFDRAVVVYGDGNVILKGKPDEYTIVGNIEDVELSGVVNELIQRRLLLYERSADLERVLVELERTHPDYTAQELA